MSRGIPMSAIICGVAAIVAGGCEPYSVDPLVGIKASYRQRAVLSIGLAQSDLTESPQHVVNLFQVDLGTGGSSLRVGHVGHPDVPMFLHAVALVALQTNGDTRDVAADQTFVGCEYSANFFGIATSVGIAWHVAGDDSSESVLGTFGIGYGVLF